MYYCQAIYHSYRYFYAIYSGLVESNQSVLTNLDCKFFEKLIYKFFQNKN